MPVGEFWEAMRAYGERQEANARHIGELVRGAALRLFNVQLRRKDQISRPEKFWAMPWDEDDRSRSSCEAAAQPLDKLLGLVEKL